MTTPREVSTIAAASSPLMANPCSARSIAGAITFRSGIVPQRARAVVRPASVPGTPTEIPLVDACVKVRLPNWSRRRGRGGLLAAVDDEGLAGAGEVDDREPHPPIPEYWGSTTLSASWIAAAASIAFPPASSIRAPASAARGARPPPRRLGCL